MKKSELDAIAYAYAEKNRSENRDKIIRLSLYPVFRAQKVYKTMTWFFKAREKYSEKYEKMINDIREKMDFEGNYEQWMAENSFERAEIIAHKARASRCAVVVSECERELDRILKNAVEMHYGDYADGN